MESEEYVLIENRGYGIVYAECYGTEEECQDEFDKITSNHYGDLDDRRNGDGDPWGYAVITTEEWEEEWRDRCY
jgi:hypothetical protein